MRGPRYRAVQAYLHFRILDLILCRSVHKGGARRWARNRPQTANDRLDVDRLADALRLLAAARASRCSLDVGSVGAILVSVMAVLHVVEQCANARQLGGEIPPMAIPVVCALPAVAGAGFAFRTTAQRGEDLVIGRSLHATSVWLLLKDRRLYAAA